VYLNIVSKISQIHILSQPKNGTDIKIYQTILSYLESNNNEPLHTTATEPPLYIQSLCTLVQLMNDSEKIKSLESLIIDNLFRYLLLSCLIRAISFLYTKMLIPYIQNVKGILSFLLFTSFISSSQIIT
jgi:hypothetical protein